MTSFDGPESLLAEARWLERLARHLVADPHTAQDLAQEAWLAANGREQPIRAGRRAWLTGVLRRLAARAHRSQERRTRRELARATPGLAPSAAELSARAELHGHLLEHVRALAEAYRVPLLLRYYDDLPPRTIAAKLGLPTATVHTRIRRALEQLRARFDAGHPGGRAGWVAVLCMRPSHESASPLASAPRPPIPRLALVGSLVGVTIAVASLWPSGADAPPVSRVATAPPAPPDATTGATEIRHAARVATTAETVPPDASPTWSGLVVDGAGRPIAGAVVTAAPHLGIEWKTDSDRIELRAGAATTTFAPTDQRGEFHGARPAESMELRASHDGMLTVLVGIWRPDADREPCVVMAPSRRLQGRVAGDDGRPLAQAEVVVTLPADLEALRTRGARGLHALDWTTTTDADGTFSFAAIPAVAEATLRITLIGHHDGVVELGRLASPVVLQRWEHPYAGRLLDERGQPLVGAAVGCGGFVARTDDAGRFVLPTAPDAANAPLLAAAPGRQPTSLVAQTEGTPFVLAAPALAIDGTVLGPDGNAFAGCDVALADPTVVGAETAPCVLEAIAADARSLVHRVRTDAHGGFRIGGLAARAYRLRVVDPTTAAWFTTEPIAPGSTTIARPPHDLLRQPWQLRFRSTDGQPIVGADIAVQGPGHVLRVPGAAEREVLFAQGSSGRTDERGELLLTRVPRTGVSLRVAHRTIGIVSLDVAAIDATAGTVQLPRIGELVIRGANASGEAWCELLDADGHALPMTTFAGVSMRTTTRWPLHDGCSPILCAPETGVLLRVLDPSGERRRLPVTIRPGDRVHVDA